MLLLEALGFPIPGALALLATGAAVASGAMQLTIALPVAVLAMLAGDFILYIAGRYSGWGLLGVLCGISVSPEVCILRSAKWFYQRGRMTLVVAKFIPGVNTMAPPLAGSMNMRAAQFLPLDLAGVLCYVFAYGSVGFVFSDMLPNLELCAASPGPACPARNCCRCRCAPRAHDHRRRAQPRLLRLRGAARTRLDSPGAQ